MRPQDIPRDVILTGQVRYGVARNVPALDRDRREVKIAMVAIERDNGAFQTLAISEDLIRFAGIGVIEREVKQAVGL